MVAVLFHLIHADTLDMDKQFADNLLGMLQTKLTTSVWASYDMISPADSFGRMMAQNLQDAGFHVPGFTAFPSLKDQEARFYPSHPQRAAVSCSMATAHDIVLTMEEKEAANKIERLDELEEWEMLMSHYCITFATNNESLYDLVRVLPSS